MKNFKKILAVVLAMTLIATLFAACGEKPQEDDKQSELGLITSPLAAPELNVDYKVKDDFKIGFICLHDEKSTYDLNFINAAKAAQKAIGLSDEQVLFKYNIDEVDACYIAAKEASWCTRPS